MARTIDAIYKDGQLRLLEKVDFHEGERIKVMLTSERDTLRGKLGNLIVQWSEDEDAPADIDEEALRAELTEAMKGQSPLSEQLIAERHEGP